MGDEIIEKSFNVKSSSDTQSFGQFIYELRRVVQAPVRPVVMQEALRLREQRDNPTRWLDLRLTNAEHTIILRLRTDNLYAVGFRNGQGRWFELQHNNDRAPMIQGATFLPFHESYIGAGGLQLDEGLEVGRDAINGAINLLAGYDGTAANNHREVKRCLLTLIVSFVESMRLNTVLNFVEDRMAAKARGRKLGWFLLRMIKDWSSLCALLLQVVNDVVQDTEVLRQRFQAYANMGIHNAFELAKVLGMVLVRNTQGNRPKRAVNDNVDGAVAGVTLVEIIDVIVRDIDAENPGDLYGVISVSDSFGSQQVFNREMSNDQSVKPGDKARLTGPGRAVCGASSFAINFKLMDKDTFSRDDEISKGEVVWNPLDATSYEFDQLRNRIVTGAYGAVELLYAVMTDAAVATVEVVVLDNSEDVYGSITTTTSLENDTPVTITLLDATVEEAIGVERRTPIPLLRKAVAVPLCSQLKVDVDLRAKQGSLLAKAVFQPFGVIRAAIDLIHGDDHIANGSETFTPHLHGEEKKEVSGEDGRVEVRVSWSTWF